MYSNYIQEKFKNVKLRSDVTTMLFKHVIHTIWFYLLVKTPVKYVHTKCAKST